MGVLTPDQKKSYLLEKAKSMGIQTEGMGGLSTGEKFLSVMRYGPKIVSEFYNKAFPIKTLEKNPINLAEGVKQGFTGGLSIPIENTRDYLLQKAVGSPKPYAQIRSQNQSLRPSASVLGQIAGSLGLESSFPNVVNNLTTAAARKLLPVTQASGAVGKFLKPIVSGALSGAATGATLETASNLDQPDKISLGAPTIIGGGLGAIGGGIEGIGNIISGNKNKIIESLNSDISELRKNKSFTNFVEAVRNKFKALPKGSSDVEISGMFASELSKFDKSIGEKFNLVANKYLTKDPAFAEKTVKMLMGQLDDLGLVKVSESGKPIIKMTDSGPKLSKSSVANEKIIIGKVPADEQNQMFKAFQTVTNPKTRTIEGMQDAKIGFQNQANYNIPGADKISKQVGATLREDILNSVEKTHGTKARDIVAAAYKTAENDYTLRDQLNKVTGALKDGKSTESMYSAIQNLVLKNEKLLSGVKRAVGSANAKTIADDTISTVIQKGISREQNFRPMLFLKQMQDYGLGTEKDVFKRLLKQGLMTSEDYSQLVKLKTIAQTALKKGVGDIPMYGPAITEGGQRNVSTTLQKFIGQKTISGLSSQTISGAINWAAKKAATASRIRGIANAAMTTGKAIQSAEARYLLNQAMQKGKEL